MLGTSAFYNQTIRNITGAFGALFNDMSIVRTKGVKTQTVKVPLVYASSDKAFNRRTEDPTLNFNMMGQFPKMSFFLTGFGYDPNRKKTAGQQISKKTNYVFSPVPYNLEFDLYIGTTSIEDGLQIIEQILPWFNPEYTITTDAFPAVNILDNVPVVLNSVSYVDPAADTDYNSPRIIEWTLSFTAKAYLYGPDKTRTEIKHARLKLFDKLPFEEDNRFEDVVADVVPDTAGIDDPHEITDAIEPVPYKS